MKRLRLAAHADLNVYYEAEMARYPTFGEYGQHVLRRVTRDAFIDFFKAYPSIGGTALEWVLGLKQDIIVKVEAVSQTCIAFMERNGWPTIGTTENFIVFRMSARTHARKSTRSRAAVVALPEASCESA